MEKKYELISSDKPGLYRIKALRDFGLIKKGEIGGYVQSEKNLSHEGNCWFFVNEDGEIYPMGRLTNSEQFECGILSGFRYLLENHFDYRGLIPMGLALKAKEGMYESFD